MGKKKSNMAWRPIVTSLIVVLILGFGFLATYKYLENKEKTAKSELEELILDNLWYGDLQMGSASDSAITFYKDGTYIYVVKSSDIEKHKFDAEIGTYEIKSSKVIELSTQERIVVQESGEEKIEKVSEVRELQVLATGYESPNTYESINTLTVTDKYFGEEKVLYNYSSASGLGAITNLDLSKFSR